VKGLGAGVQGLAARRGPAPDGEEDEDALDAADEDTHEYATCMFYCPQTYSLITASDEGRLSRWKLTDVLRAFEVHRVRVADAAASGSPAKSSQQPRRHSLDMSADELRTSVYSIARLGGRDRKRALVEIASAGGFAPER